MVLVQFVHLKFEKMLFFHKLLRTSEHYVNIRMKELIHRFGSYLLLRSVTNFFFVFLQYLLFLSGLLCSVC